MATHQKPVIFLKYETPEKEIYSSVPCHSRAGGNPIIIRTLLHEIPACAGMTGRNNLKKGYILKVNC